MQTEHIHISGMTCGGCVSKVTQSLKAVAGVGEVSVSLSNHQATVQYDPQKTSLDALKIAVVKAGYDIETGTSSHAKPAKSGCC